MTFSQFIILARGSALYTLGLLIMFSHCHVYAATISNNLILFDSIKLNSIN
jgi:hypothetical protein